jgi:hypothetical protein
MLYLVVAENGSVTAFFSYDQAAHKAKVDGGTVFPPKPPDEPAPAAADPAPAVTPQ